MDFISKLVKSGLNSKVIGNQIQYYDILTSTMDEIHKLAKNEMPEGLVVVADKQISGRGRQGTSWVSESGNLLVSILLRPSADAIHTLQPLMAIAVQKAVIETTDLDIYLKWPNDLMISESKVGGILLESAVKDGELQYVIAGLGINLSLSTKPSDANYSVSDLNTYADSEVDKTVLLKNIIENVDAYYDKIDHPSAILNEWRSKLDVIGRCINVKCDGNILYGQVLYISDTGALGFKLDNGEVIDVTTGDIIEVFE